MYTGSLATEGSRATFTKASLKQANAPPHEIGECERSLNANLADKRDFTEGIRRALANRGMT